MHIVCSIWRLKNSGGKTNNISSSISRYFLGFSEEGWWQKLLFVGKVCFFGPSRLRHSKVLSDGLRYPWTISGTLGHLRTLADTLGHSWTLWDTLGKGLLISKYEFACAYVTHTGTLPCFFPWTEMGVTTQCWDPGLSLEGLFQFIFSLHCWPLDSFGNSLLSIRDGRHQC